MTKLITSIKRGIMNLKRPSKRANRKMLRKRGESLSSFTFREARIEDIPSLDALHVKTWAETYWTVLFPPTYEIRERQWKQQFLLTDRNWFCFVVENKNRQLVGFAKGKTYSHSDLPEFAG